MFQTVVKESLKKYVLFLAHLTLFQTEKRRKIRVVHNVYRFNINIWN